MDETTERKLFAGAKIRRFRKGLGLTQVQMAEELGLSASYLNLMERDQRPVSARVLLLLAQTFDLDLRGFASDADRGLLAGLRETAGDPILDGFNLDDIELKELAERQPRAAEALVRLHTGYRGAVQDAADLAERVAEGDRGGALGAELPMEEVRDILHARDNHFPDLEEAALTLRKAADAEEEELYSGLKRRLRGEHGVAVRVLPHDVLGDALRRYDRHSRRVLISEVLEPPSRTFQLAYQLALFEAGDRIDALVGEAPLSSPEARRLYRVGLANYVAGAVMMPYEPFLEAAESLRHDVELLALRFGASFEQACHRLTTLKRPGKRGVPFFLLRVDQAGNVSKRYGGDVFPFARSGGACPRWNLYEAFRAPGRVRAQLIELPDGARFVSLARTVRRAGVDDDVLVVGIGAPAKHAAKIAAADALDLTGPGEPIGVNCRFCERVDCRQRAHPPLRRTLYVDEHHRGRSPFAFRAE